MSLSSAPCRLAAFSAVLATMAAPLSRGADAPVLGAPTLHSLGAHWIVEDAKADASVKLEWRKSGEPAWKEGAPFLKVEAKAHLDEKGASLLTVPEGAALFAGSVLLLEPDTAYEMKLTLANGDTPGRAVELKARTAVEPIEPKGMRVRHVAPGNGGGTGTEQDPFLGFAAADAAAAPGDLFLIHVGVYPGGVTFRKSGEAGKPIIWRGAGDGETVIDGGDPERKKEERAVTAGSLHDVWIENLTIRNAGRAIVAHESWRMVVRGCHMHGVDYGITATRNEKDTIRGWFIADNVIEGPCTWPRTKGIENPRGIQITGQGNDVCYNLIRNFADAIDTFPSPRCADIDFHHNEISEMTDDGIEMDYSERNTRCFYNRFTNVFQGITVQPIFGGPVYVFRNSLYNVVNEPFKMHNSPSGGFFLHNTCVKRGLPFVVGTEAKVRHCVTRNNLFIGTEANYALEMDCPVEACDFDYDGFGGGPWKYFLKWEGVRYRTLDEVKANAPVYKHAVLVDAATAFASGAAPPDDEKVSRKEADLSLAAGSGALDAGAKLAGFNDGFAAKAPDLGAYEYGTPLPHYGPRSGKTKP